MNFLMLTERSKTLYCSTPFSAEMPMSSAFVGSLRSFSSTAMFSCLRAHSNFIIALRVNTVSSMKMILMPWLLIACSSCLRFSRSYGSSACSSGVTTFLS